MTDAGILEEVLYHIHNWFACGGLRVSGCKVADGALPASVASSLLDGQWYRISGSYLNDGLHQHPATDLTDETFDGTIDLLAIPRPLLRVVDDITAWQERNGAASEGPYASESFGGYSYTLKSDSGSNSGSGGLSGWRLAFRDRLNPWRKMA